MSFRKIGLPPDGALVDGESIGTIPKTTEIDTSTNGVTDEVDNDEVIGL